MIFWILLFLLIILVSFVLAFQSMKDFAEKPAQSKSAYGLFLIKNLKAVNSELLKLLHDQLVTKGFIFSIEKLFKGSQAALVIFGPKDFLKSFDQVLDLIELEEYTAVDPKETLAWEVNTTEGNLTGLPQLQQSEQFWWQVILKPQKKTILDKISQPKAGYHHLVKTRSGIQPQQENSFKCQIRAVVWIKDDQRKTQLAERLQQLDSGRLKKIPIPFTSPQILKMYQDRIIIASVPAANFTAEKVLDLIRPS